MIAASGALVSEYPPGTGVQKWNFRLETGCCPA